MVSIYIWPIEDPMCRQRMRCRRGGGGRDGGGRSVGSRPPLSIHDTSIHPPPASNEAQFHFTSAMVRPRFTTTISVFFQEEPQDEGASGSRKRRRKSTIPTHQLQDTRNLQLFQSNPPLRAPAVMARATKTPPSTPREQMMIRRTTVVQLWRRILLHTSIASLMSGPLQLFPGYGQPLFCFFDSDPLWCWLVRQPRRQVLLCILCSLQLYMCKSFNFDLMLNVKCFDIMLNVFI